MCIPAGLSKMMIFTPLGNCTRRMPAHLLYIPIPAIKGRHVVGNIMWLAHLRVAH